MSTSSSVNLQFFHKFSGMDEAVEACSAIAESRISSSLDNFLKESLGESIKNSEKLVVAEPKLGTCLIIKVINLLRLCQSECS